MHRYPGGEEREVPGGAWWAALRAAPRRRGGGLGGPPGDVVGGAVGGGVAGDGAAPALPHVASILDARYIRLCEMETSLLRLGTIRMMEETLGVTFFML